MADSTLIKEVIVMCGIAGLLSKKGENVIPLLRGMLEGIEHRGPDGVGVMAPGKVCYAKTIAELDWDSLRGNLAMGHTRLAVVGGSEGGQPLVSNNGQIVLLHNGEIYNYKVLRSSLEKDYHFATQTDSEVLVHLLSQHYKGDLMEAFNNIVSQLDGVYAIAVSDGKEIVIARDLIGVKQLYWGENEKLVAFASEKKGLWNLGLRKDIHRLLPGEAVRLSFTGFEKTRRTPDFLCADEPAIHDPGEALETYETVLREAVQKRIPDLEQVGVIFSGGVDSVIIATIAKELGANMTCYTAGVADADDIDFAKRAAAQIGVPIQVNELNDQTLLDFVVKAIASIEDRSLGQVEVAVPIIASVELAYQDGQIVLLTGQGADELFAGYPWYRRIMEVIGYDELESRMWDDLNQLYKETLEREDKITMAYGIELRVPYLDPQVIRVAFDIDPRLKVRSAKDLAGKYIHRVLASTIGVPEEIAWRPKEAAQHGAGIHNRLLALAEEQGFTESVAKQLGYRMDEELEENLGSSQRYGFKYDDSSRWATQDHVQLWLDRLAYEHGLLSSAEQEQLEPYLAATTKIIRP
jgi:asparagine synthase (glutamine-hydrolysing)